MTAAGVLLSGIRDLVSARRRLYTELCTGSVDNDGGVDTVRGTRAKGAGLR